MQRTTYFEKKAINLLSLAGITVNGKNPQDITVNDKSIYIDAFTKGSLGFADGYIAGKFEAKHLDIFFEKLLLAGAAHMPSVVNAALGARDLVFNTQIGRRAFQVGNKHYDLGNGMYQLFLGESMGYSCGLYEGGNTDLTKAQYNKFDVLCKKLNLKPGMKILEIGTGWGTFARHAAKNYGVEVIGLTVSKEQKKFAEERCKGLPVKFLLLDYQKLGSKYSGYFDRVVSIEMIEAVGKKNFKTYFATIKRALKQDGLVGIQAIIGDGKDDAFLSTRIFPNGHVPSPQEISNGIKGLLWVKKWDTFGPDYDKTLLAWHALFVKNWPKISNLKDEQGNALYDEKFYRMWRYYLLCCAATFRVGRNDVAQIVLGKSVLSIK